MSSRITPGSFVQVMIKSVEALMNFANDTTSCRRVGIMNHFGETAPYKRCGSCDTCENHTQFGDDANRDYTAEASVLFECLRSRVCPLPPTTAAEFACF